MVLSAGLRKTLEAARQLGFLGPGPIEGQYGHARDLAGAVGEFQGSMLDLGSGGGIPGLVLADEWPAAVVTLLDSQRRRCAFLTAAVSDLDLADRVRVVCGRAEVLARVEHLRAQFDLVVARSFASPATTAECAVGFLRVGGALVVSEPPDAEGTAARWDPDGMAQLGFEAVVALRRGTAGAVRAVLATEPAERWPRRDGVPSKRPLW